MLRINSPLELPDDVLTYKGTDFFNLVNQKCGEVVKDLMEILSIDSVKTLLGVEDDIFIYLKENCNALKGIKERACLCLDDETFFVKPGLRIDLNRFLDALRARNTKNQFSKTTTSLSDNNYLLSDKITFETFEENSNSFLKKFVDNIASNRKKSKNNYRYNESTQNFAQVLYILGGRNVYEFARLNLVGALPSIPSIETYITVADGHIIEGEFRYDALRRIQTANDYQLAVCSEDCTNVVQKVTYNSSTNSFVGLSTPLEHGIPISQYYQTDSYIELQEWFENNDKSSLLNVHMLELLPRSKSFSYPFLLGAYGITSKFDSIDVLHRWMWIYENCRSLNIRILLFSTDCDPKYLRAMRLITGFFAKLPNIRITERNDAFGINLPKTWSSWFFMRTRQLFFCFQDPVHLCTKIRNRLLSSSASMIIGDGKISINFLLDLIKNQSKLIHGLVKTDILPKDKQNFSSCVKISSDDVLSSLEEVSDSYTTQVYLRIIRSVILAYVESNVLVVDRIYHSWLTVFICRLWWTWLQLVDMKSISTQHENTDKNFFFITKAAYHSIEINAHTLLSVVLLVIQKDLPESALSISSFNSQTCENIFRLSRAMSGTFSSNVNFTVDQFLRRARKLSVLQDIERKNEIDVSECSLQFPKHHKRRYKKVYRAIDNLQVFSNALTITNIENIINHAFNDAYKTLSELDIGKVLEKAKKNKLNELSTFVRIEIEQKCRTIDFSSNWDDYSDEESDSEAENILTTDEVSSESCSEDESDELYTNSSQNKSEFQGIRIFNEIPSSQKNSFFRIKIDEKEKYIHKQTACWLLTDSKASLSSDRLQRVQQTNRSLSRRK